MSSDKLIIEDRVLDGTQVGPVQIAFESEGTEVGQVSVEDSLLNGAGSSIVLEVSEDVLVTGLDELTEIVDEIERDRLAAQGSADVANNAATRATDQVRLATNEANRARMEADRASQITGLDTVEQAVDSALNDLPGVLVANTVSMEARRAINRERFAGSGWEHFGKVVSSSSWQAVNEGLWCRTGTNTDTTVLNSFFIGRTAAPVLGDSKTDEGVMQMAGFTVHLDSLGISAAGQALIKVDEAPTGAVTYDSATGTVLDFETQTDPKYGNIAADRNEAVARAFEGLARNGDFRLGDNGNWTNVGTAPSSVTYGDNHVDIAASTTAFNTGYQTVVALTAGVEYRVTATVEVLSEIGVGGERSVRLLDSSSDASGVGVQTFGREVGTYEIDFTGTSVSPAASARLRIRIGGQSGSVRLSNVSLRPVTNEVVTRRVDMWGFEGFLEEVTQSNPFVYPNGLIQSQATTINGINTVVGTRPTSYYAVFDGDTGSVGRGVNFFTATDAQKEAMLGDPKNNLYRLEDGRLVQFRVRQRTINGPGNGDWGNVFANAPSTVEGGYLRYSAPAYVKPQGMRDAPITNSSIGISTQGLFGNRNSAWGTSFALMDLGLFTALDSFNDINGIPSCGVNGECYFLVGGTASRLNQGAYHPELNSFGARQWKSSRGVGSSDSWSTATANVGSTVQDCFMQFNQNQPADSIGAADWTGVIGQNSGRTNDSRLHNAIYADGLGGVVDYRWSANDRSDPKWGAKAKLEVEAGTYRGLELLQRTHVQRSTQTAVATLTNIFDQLDISRISVGDTAYCENATGNFEEVTITNVFSTGSIQFSPSISGRTENGLIVITGNLDVSVSGNFTRTDTIADPVRLLATFPTGVEGGWINEIPDGTSTTFRFNKKFTNTGVLSAVNTDNNGTSWSPTTFTADSATNSHTFAFAATRVRVVSYTAFAKQTERSANTEVLNTQNGQYGVTATATSFTDRGSLLAESLLGKVLTSTVTANGIIQSHPFIVFNIEPSVGQIAFASGRESQHPPLTLAAPTNNSRGVKYAAHQVDDNGQATLNFIFNELDHDGTDWGDDSRLRVLNGTYTNQNGVSGLQANVDRLSIAYGIIKNEV